MIGNLVIPGSNINILIPVLEDEGMFQQLLVLRSILVVLEQAIMNKLSEFW
jgi:hypothetical protein